MSYFMGKNLERKIREYNLGDFDKALTVFIESGGWSGTLMIPAEIDILESTRIVVYSILHKYGLKEAFKVKLLPARKILTVELTAKGEQTGGTYPQQTDSGLGYREQTQEVSAETTEDLLGILKVGVSAED